jgi:hypothetical protein
MNFIQIYSFSIHEIRILLWGGIALTIILYISQNMYTMCVCIYICKIYHNMWNNLFVIKIKIHISISTLKPLLPKAWSWVHITVVCKVHGDGGFFFFLFFSIVNFVSRRRRRWPNPIDQVRTRLRLWFFFGVLDWGHIRNSTRTWATWHS